MSKLQKRGILLLMLALMLQVISIILAIPSNAQIKNGYEVKSLGIMTISAYSPVSNTPSGSRATCTGKSARSDHTIAVDMHNPVCGYGKMLLIGDTVYTTEDCGNLNKYGRDLDIFFDTEEEADKWGVKDKEVYLIVGKSTTKKKSDTEKPKPTLTNFIKNIVDMRFKPKMLFKEKTYELERNTKRCI